MGECGVISRVISSAGEEGQCTREAVKRASPPRSLPAVCLQRSADAACACRPPQTRPTCIQWARPVLPAGRTRRREEGAGEGGGSLALACHACRRRSVPRGCAGAPEGRGGARLPRVLLTSLLSTPRPPPSGGAQLQCPAADSSDCHLLVGNGKGS